MPGAVHWLQQCTASIWIYRVRRNKFSCVHWSQSTCYKQAQQNSNFMSSQNLLAWTKRMCDIAIGCSSLLLAQTAELEDTHVAIFVSNGMLQVYTEVTGLACLPRLWHCAGILMMSCPLMKMRMTQAQWNIAPNTAAYIPLLWDTLNGIQCARKSFCHLGDLKGSVRF